MPPFLASLLASDACDHDAQFRRGLSNHLPMALVALAELGASEARIREFHSRYVARLEPQPLWRDGDLPWTLEDVAKNLGTHTHFAELHAWMRARVHSEGAEATARRVLPMLVTGLAGAAFHGLIRVAYALGTGGCPADEVAASLAYMADVYLPIGGREELTPAPSASWPIPTALDEAARTPEARAYVAKGGLIFDDLAAVASEPSFARLLSLAPPECSIEEVARAALRAYASTMNFTALHCVTAAHALRMIAPLLKQPEKAAGVLARALVVAYVTIAAPPLLDEGALAALRVAEVPTWDEISLAACASDDEHVIKMVWTARAEHDAYRDPLYRFVAARTAGLVGD